MLPVPPSTLCWQGLRLTTPTSRTTTEQACCQPQLSLELADDLRGFVQDANKLTVKELAEQQIEHRIGQLQVTQGGAWGAGVLRDNALAACIARHARHASHPGACVTHRTSNARCARNTWRRR